MSEDRFSELLLSKPAEDNQSGFRAFSSETYHELYQIALDKIRYNQTYFTFDLKQHFDNQDFSLFEGASQSLQHAYKRQGGGDVFSYVSLEKKAISRPVVEVSEQLAENLDTGIELLPKTHCVEWAAVLPYILKALIDNCLINKIIGVSFTILEIRFHPVDYRPYAYYTCTRQLLEKMK